MSQQISDKPTIQDLRNFGILATYSGPLPPAEQLEAYERLYSGAAKLFFDKFAEEQAHRHAMERNESDANIRSMDKYYEIKSHEEKSAFIGNLTGQYLSVLICLAGLASCVFLAVRGYEWVAIAVIAIPFAGIIRAMRSGKEQSSRPPQPSNRPPPHPNQNL